MKFSKIQLDELTSLCGLITAIITVLISQDFIPEKTGLTITGIVSAIAFYLSNKPAKNRPNTEDLEESN